MPMRRSDRRNESDDNALNHPRSQAAEPLPYEVLKQRYQTARSQREELQAERDALQQQYQGTLVQYEDVQQQAQSYLALYTQEQARSATLLTQYETAQAESQHYLALYQQVQDELKFERKSKAGIKGWETRRKRENERLKQEIMEMTQLIRDSMEREETALNNLDEFASRMDRIQSLVNAVESDTVSNPLGFIQKVQRIFQAVKDILAE